MVPWCCCCTIWGGGLHTIFFGKLIHFAIWWYMLPSWKMGTLAPGGPKRSLGAFFSWKLKFYHFFIIFHIHVHIFDFFINFMFFIFRLVFGICDSQIHFLGLISCPGLLPNRSGLKFYIYLNFRVHMVFMCRFSLLHIYLEKNFPRHGVGTWTTRP